MLLLPWMSTLGRHARQMLDTESDVGDGLAGVLGATTPLTKS